MPQMFEDWVSIIEQIVKEMSELPKRAAGKTVLDAWRRKLEQEPPHLQPYQIDMIVREVNRRLTDGDKHGTQ